jgi:hypothetical protein
MSGQAVFHFLSVAGGAPTPASPPENEWCVRQMRVGWAVFEFRPGATSERPKKNQAGGRFGGKPGFFSA